MPRIESNASRRREDDRARCNLLTFQACHPGQSGPRQQCSPSSRISQNGFLSSIREGRGFLCRPSLPADDDTTEQQHSTNRSSASAREAPVDAQAYRCPRDDEFRLRIWQDEKSQRRKAASPQHAARPIGTDAARPPGFSAFDHVQTMPPGVISIVPREHDRKKRRARRTMLNSLEQVSRPFRLGPTRTPSRTAQQRFDAVAADVNRRPVASSTILFVHAAPSPGRAFMRRSPS